MPVTLGQIVAARRRSVAAAKSSADVAALERAADAHVPRGFRSRLHAVGQAGPAIIAELKQASPSRGILRAAFDPVALARELEPAGAAALSVLTEEEHFQGSLANLRAASAATSLPCLRKDFIVDAFQVLEARAHRADAVLLIVAALSAAELTTLAAAAREWQLDVLCEVHDERELEAALAAGCDLIGVNSRNLRTFEVDLRTALRLAARIPRPALRVAESGIHSGDDVRRLLDAGYDAFLVGESLMKAPHPGNALRELLAATGATRTATGT